MTNWKERITATLTDCGETWKDVESCTLTDDEMAESFNSGFGGTEGLPFTVWTVKRVYFPICYDGSEWVGSVARNPDGKPTEHQGG